MTLTDSILKTCFWCSAGGVGYTYLGYPVLIHTLSRLCGRSQSIPDVPDSGLPRVALLIAAHNEASVIEERILNALSLDYPRELIDIVIASDGSNDGTPDICRSFEGRVRVLDFPVRRGKAETLNAAIPHLNADIVAFSDANTSMDPGALRRLASWFTDPRVGAVCGRLILSDSGRNADGLYWRFETALKACEGNLGGLLGANGAIYAIRRELFQPLPPGTMVDDFVIPLAAKLKSGCRIVFDPDAIAHEETAPNLRAEFRRRARIGAGALQSLATLWPLLSPRHGWTALALWSHKVLRWACPLLLISALLASIALVGHPVYRAAVILQVAFYALCVIGALVPSANRGILRLFPMFAAMNLALLVGFIRWMRGTRSGVWNRTARLGEGKPVA